MPRCCIKLNIEIDLCNSLLDKLYLVMKQNIAENSYTKEDLVLLQRNINIMQEHYCSKWTSLTNTITTVSDITKNKYGNYWIDFLFPEKLNKQLNSENI